MLFLNTQPQKPPNPPTPKPKPPLPAHPKQHSNRLKTLSNCDFMRKLKNPLEWCFEWENRRVNNFLVCSFFNGFLALFKLLCSFFAASILYNKVVFLFHLFYPLQKLQQLLKMMLQTLILKAQRLILSLQSIKIMVSPLKTYKYTSTNVKIYVSIRIFLGSEPRFIRLEAGFIRLDPRNIRLDTYISWVWGRIYTLGTKISWLRTYKSRVQHGLTWFFDKLNFDFD